jgi:hypothetical protein
MTASNGPAQVEQRTAHCDRFRRAGSDRRQGRRRDRELELQGILHRKGRVHEDERRTKSASHRWQGHLPLDSRSRYLADALGLLSLLERRHLHRREKPADPWRTRNRRHRFFGALAAFKSTRSDAGAEPGGCQLARVQVAALHMRPPSMHPSSLMVFASCKVRLPE